MQQSRKRHFEFYLGLWTLVLLAASAVMAYLQPFRKQAAVDNKTILELRAADTPGRIRVDWDSQDEGVRRAENGTLDVVDGGLRNKYPVVAQVLQSGGFDYIRKSEDVLLMLTLLRNGQVEKRGVLRTVGPVRSVVPEAVAAAPPRERVQTRARRR